MKFASAASAAAAALLLSLPAAGDVFVRGDIRLSAGTNYGEYDLVADVPMAVTTSGALSLPDACRATASQGYPRGDRRIHAWTLGCERHLTPADRITLPFALDAARITFRDGHGTLESVVAGADPLVVALPEPLAAARSVFAIAADYTAQGVAHIAEGFDHLAFVLCLCLLTVRLRALLALITAFTLGHSVSMALSFLGIVDVAIAPIEAIIAMSIVWMAREAMLAPAGGPPRAPARHVVIVTGFGLLHGLGFASALQQLGVVAAERTWALGFFNVGVELGQVAFVLAVSAAMALARAASLSRPLARAALYGAGGIGAFWTIERLAGFPVFTSFA